MKYKYIFYIIIVILIILNINSIYTLFTHKKNYPLKFKENKKEDEYLCSKLFRIYFADVNKIELKN